MVFRKIAAVLGGLATLAATACEEVPFQTVVEYRQGGDNFSFFQYAASKGPFWVDVRGNPFGGDLAPLERTIVKAFKNGMPQLGGVRFTTDKNQAAEPVQRIVVVFEPPQGLSPQNICDGAVPADLGKLRANGEVHAYTVYCSKEQARIVVSGIARGITGPEDKALRKMLTHTLIEMFKPGSL
ncbi:exported protein of unknown function [Magnetospira sp. QH-2]|nr:exported protein of unknown function [Magnetospira sp. QH-2]